MLRVVRRFLKQPWDLLDAPAPVEVDPRFNRPTEAMEIHNHRLEMPEIEARLFKAVAAFPRLDPRTFSIEQRFEELQLDSLDTIQLLTLIESEFKTVFEENVFDNFESCRDVARYLASTKYAL